MKQYTRLRLAEREEISGALAAGSRLRVMARPRGRAPSPVGQELRRAERTRSTDRVTRGPHVARRAAQRPRKRLTHPPLQASVPAHLTPRWSPEPIARRLKAEYPNAPTMRVSHETIDTYLYVLPRGALKRELLQALRHRRKHRRGRRGSPERRGTIPAMLSREERPAEGAGRPVPGPWEGDVIVGRRTASALGTLVERTTRPTLLVPLRAKEAPSVRQAFAREMRTVPQQMARSLTSDQDKEMAEHELFTHEPRIQVYFAHPHSPWERGTTENTNGLIRQCFPKGTDFSRIPRRQITHGQTRLNARPRKVLNWRTPSEAFHNVPVALGT